jgi:hypothetical protein
LKQGESTAQQSLKQVKWNRLQNINV